MLELQHALENINYDVLGLAEVRRIGNKIEEYDEHIFCYVGETIGLHGVGFLIKKKYKSNILNFTGISERVALLRMKFSEDPISLIQVYAPTEQSSEEEIDKFYNDLQKTHDLSDKTVMVLGDFNARIGEPEVHEQLIMGKYGYGKRNKRGEKLIQYANEYKLSIINTYFKKSSNRRWTWISPDSKTKNEIDFILSNQPNNITNFEVLSKVKFPSDHRLLRVSIKISKPKKSRKAFKTLPKPPTTDKEISNYLENLHENTTKYLPFLQTTNEVQAYYNKIEEIITTSLKIKEENKKTRKTSDILSENTLQLINRRSELIHTNTKTKQIKDELKDIFKKTSKSIREDYNNYRRKIIEANITQYRSTKRANKKLNTHKDWIQALKKDQPEQGHTNTRKEVLERATQFYKILYTRSPEANDQEETIITEKQENRELQPILDREVLNHIKKLKNEKSPGPDGISNEALKTGAPILLTFLTRLFNTILEAGIVPRQWCESDIVLLYKKGNPLDIENYRPISLLPSTYKLFASVILSRISEKIDSKQPIEQAGFRSGYSTIDHIHSLEQVIEKFKEYNQPLYLGFIDYSKAFDSISHSSIWKALRSCNVEEKYITILRNIYTNSSSIIKLESKGDKISIERGVRQGDPLSPKLFIAVLEDIFQNISWSKQGIWITDKHLSHLRFADDIVIFAKSALELQQMIQNLSKESNKVGLQLNTSKTKVMTNGPKKTIRIDSNNQIDYVEAYIYLGKQISFSQDNNEKEVERRLNCSWKSFWSQKEIMKGNYNMALKKIVMDTCILPSLVYGCQTWTFTNNIKNKITTTQRAMERSMLKFKKLDKIRSEVIRKKTQVTDARQHALKLKWQWAGHITRYKDKRWTSKTTLWTGPLGKRNVGRPKKRWVDDIIEVAGKSWWRLGLDKEQWKKMEEAYTQKGSI